MLITESKLRSLVKSELMRIDEIQVGAFEISRAGVTIEPAVAAVMNDWLAPVADSTLYSVVSIFDPTGAMSWPLFYDAWAKYSRDRSSTNGILLVLALIGCIPMLGKSVTVPRLLSTAFKSQKALLAVGKATSKIEKLKIVGKSLWMSGASWKGAIDEIAPHADDIVKQIKKVVPSAAIDSQSLIKLITEAATVVDKYKTSLKYINHVIANAAENVQQMLLGRFMPNSVRAIDQTLATTAAKVSAGSGAALPVVAVKVPIVAAKAATAISNISTDSQAKWASYVEKSSRYGAVAAAQAKKISDHLTKNGTSYESFVKWYNQTRQDPAKMLQLKKQPGQHIAFDELLKLLNIP